MSNAHDPGPRKRLPETYDTAQHADVLMWMLLWTIVLGSVAFGLRLLGH